MGKTVESANWRGRPVHGVLFDLDGTLLDTASDIATALNMTLGEHGVAPLPVADVARMIGRGAPTLIERAAHARGFPLVEPQRTTMIERFFKHYGELEETNRSDAAAFSGAAEALQALHQAGLAIAIVTNKQRRFADALLHRLQLIQWVQVVVGGDTCPRRKPDPQPLLFACEALGLSPAEVLMVGDSINDVMAARAANIPVICVPYGYNEGQDPRTLPCDALVETLADLPGLLWRPLEP